MAKNIVPVEIKKIQLEIESDDLGYVEITDLAAKVEQKMMQLQRESGIVDTLKQALLVAVSFAADAYLKGQSEGGKRKEADARLDELIVKLTASLDAAKK